MIEFNNVSFSYDATPEMKSISNLSLTVKDGECVLITGPSGCGKSTLLRLLNGLIPEFYSGKIEGDIYIDNKDIQKGRIEDKAGIIGTVFQNPRSQFFNVDTTSELAFGLENLAFPEQEILLNKLVSNYIFFTFCIIIYLAGTLPFIDIFKPKFKAIALWILCVYILAGILLILAHGIATLIRKFGPTYGISMALYFSFLILGGYMGLPVSKLPKALRYISDLLPTTQLGSDYLDFWVGRDYNFGPLIQSMIFFLALSAAILIIAFKVRGRKR